MTQDVAGDARHSQRAGLIAGFISYSMWGVMPPLFHAMHGVGTFDILSLRLLIAMVMLVAVITLWKRWDGIFEVIRTPRSSIALLLSSAFILSNWLVFIYAARNGHIVESSLGYFINPLVNVALGMLLLSERMRRVQILAVGLAALGVVIFAIDGGGVLWIALLQACSFSFYGFARKITPVGPLDGLTIETIFLSPIAILFLIYGPGSEPGAFNTTNILLIILAGPAMILPLFLFVYAAHRLSYSVLGLLQYTGPTLQLGAGVWLGEPVRAIHAISFGFIWTALAIFAVDAWIFNARSRDVTPKPV